MKVTTSFARSGRAFALARRFLLAVTCLGVAALSTAPVSAQTVYVAGSSDTFGSFNLSTRQYTQISASLGGGITYNLTSNGTGALFGTQNSGSGNDTFVGITLGGVVTQIGAVNGIGDEMFGLARATNGTVYGYGGITSTVGTVNTSTGAYTSLGAAGFAASSLGGGDLAFAGLTLYATSSANGGSLHTVNTTTGAFSAQIGASDANYSSGVVFGVGPALYVLNADNLYSADTTTGALTLLGALTGANLPASFDAAFAVPEPSTWALFGVGVTVVGAMALRRRMAGA